MDLETSHTAVWTAPDGAPQHRPSAKPVLALPLCAASPPRLYVEQLSLHIRFRGAVCAQGWTLLGLL